MGPQDRIRHPSLVTPAGASTAVCAAVTRKGEPDCSGSPLAVEGLEAMVPFVV